MAKRKTKRGGRKDGKFPELEPDVKYPREKSELERDLETARNKLDHEAKTTYFLHEIRDVIEATNDLVDVLLPRLPYYERLEKEWVAQKASQNKSQLENTEDADIADESNKKRRKYKDDYSDLDV